MKHLLDLGHTPLAFSAGEGIAQTRPEADESGFVSYFPTQEGARWLYESPNGSSRQTRRFKGTELRNGKQYARYELQDEHLEDLLFRADGEKVFCLNPRNGSEEFLFLDEFASPHTKWNISRCGVGTSLAYEENMLFIQRHTVHHVAGESYEDVLEMAMELQLGTLKSAIDPAHATPEDYQWISAKTHYFFARGVGIIEERQDDDSDAGWRLLQSSF